MMRSPGSWRRILRRFETPGRSGARSANGTPVHRHGAVTLVTRYGDVRRLAKDTRLSSAYHAGVSTLRGDLGSEFTDEQRAMHSSVSEFESRYVSRSDGEAHDRLRGIMHRAFTPRRMNTLTEQIRRSPTRSSEVARRRESSTG